MTNEIVKERINLLTMNEVNSIEYRILQERHIERYALVRKFAFGKVIDIACGIGYGSYLLSKNPDIQCVHGFDPDEKTINHAKNNFSCEKTIFTQGSVETLEEDKVDTLVSLETIEHLKNPNSFKLMIKRNKPKRIIISFPNKKTTHYNKYHLWDIQNEDVIIMLRREYGKVHAFDFYDSSFMIFDRKSHSIEEKFFL